MAALQFYVDLVSTPVTASTAKTIVQIAAPTNQRVKVTGYSFFLDGATSTNAPAQIRILRQTTAGTSLVAATPVIIENELTETVQSTCQIGSQTTQTEPTAGTVLKTIAIPQYNGMYEVFMPFDQPIIIGGGTRLGFELNSPNNVNVRGHVAAEE